MDDYEPSRLDLGDVCSQRGGKKRLRAPEDNKTLFFLVLSLFMFFTQHCRCSGTTMAEPLQHIWV